MKFKSQLFLLPILLIISCGQADYQDESKTAENTENESQAIASKAKNDFVLSVEKAHQTNDFLESENVQFDIKLYFGGNERLDATITMATNSTSAVIEKRDGSRMIYTGEKSFVFPDSAIYKKARFDMFTWTYFFALPYKLSDPGTQWSTFTGEKTINETEYKTKKLTFDSNIGDSPDDWYVLYSDPETNLLNYAAYIVTLSKSTEEAEKDPHAIQYSDYKDIDGIPIAHSWTFWAWAADSGTTDKLGYAEVSNISFPQLDDSFYNVPENAAEIE